MSRLRKMIYASVMVSVMLMLQACPPDPEPISITTNNLSFSATNLNEVNKITVNSTYENTTVNWNIAFEIDGKKYPYSGESKKNVLPVLAGNEIDVTFMPSADEHEATFTLPDGTIQKVTRENPSFKWTVPQIIKTGDQISGISSYVKDNVEYSNTGRILFEVVNKE